MEINGKWFYKSPSARTIDLMPAFSEKPLLQPTELYLNIFATPADGVNTDNGAPDWTENYYAELAEMPSLRVRFEPVGTVR